MLIEKIPVGIYGANCYIISCKNTKMAAIIDPGGNAEDLIDYIDRLGLTLKYIVLTHGHADHIGAVPRLIALRSDIHIYIHEMDSTMLSDSKKNFSEIMGGPLVQVSGESLKDGDMLILGDLHLEIIHTPGHTPGSICIKVKDCLLTGDTLFDNSIGRTDLEGGSYDQILDSIKRKILVLDDKMKVMPGHGSASTIGKERMNNPFLII